MVLLVYLITHFIPAFSPTMTGIIFTTLFSAFCTVPKHSGNEMLGQLGHSKILTSFTLISLKNPVFYYLYSENFYCKVPRETNAFSSPPRVSRSRGFREDKLVHLQRAWT